MPKFYYGWVMVVITALTLAMAMGTTMYAFGLYVLPVSEEFGLSRAEVNTAAIMLNLGMSFSAPFVGKLVDRFSARLIIGISGLVFGLSFVGLALSHSVLLSALILALPMAVSMAGGAAITGNAVVARWFTIYRGRAMSLAAVGLSLGGILITPLVALLIERVEWRQTLMISGVVLAAAFLLLAQLVRDRPGPNDIEDANAKAPAPAAHNPASAKPTTALEILRSPYFWIIALCTGITVGSAQAVALTLVPLGSSEGLSPAQGAILISIMSLSAFLGKFVLAAIADKVDKHLLLAITIGALAALYLAFLTSHTFILLAACGFGLGACTSALSPVLHLLFADRFGAASFGTATGLGALLVSILAAICMRYAGEVFDRSGGYDLMFISFAAALVVVSLIFFFMRRPAPQPVAHSA